MKATKRVILNGDIIEEEILNNPFYNKNGRMVILRRYSQFAGTIIEIELFTHLRGKRILFSYYFNGYNEETDEIENS